MEPFNYEAMAALSADLPEDIQKEKDAGSLSEAIRLIDVWLSKPGDTVPRFLRNKLTVERDILERLPGNYPYTEAEIKAELKKVLPDITDEEFIALRDGGRLDWIYVDGEKRYFDDAVAVVLNDPAMEERSCKLLGKPYVPFSEGFLKVRSALPVMKEKGEMAIRFTEHFGVRAADDAFKKGMAHAWLPVPAAGQQIEDVKILGTSEGCKVTLAPESAPQRTILLEKELTENEELWVEFCYTDRAVYRDLWSAERKLPATPAGTPVTEDDLSEQLPHIQFTPYMRALAAEITEDITEPIEKARAIYLYITSHVKYSYVRSYFLIENLSEYAAINKKGDCGIQALMFITLCRICGIPARWQSGNGVKPGYIGCHDWAQFYIDGYGWLFADPSYGGGAYEHGDDERREFYFGNLDPWRMVAATRFMTQFTPAPKYIRHDPVDNQSGELQYDDKALGGGEFIPTKELLQYEILDS